MTTLGFTNKHRVNVVGKVAHQNVPHAFSLLAKRPSGQPLPRIRLGLRPSECPNRPDEIVEAFNVRTPYDIRPGAW